jgi:hypothetical protein
MMVDAVEIASMKAVTEEEYAKKIQELYPEAEEELIDFLNKCKLNNTEVMLCPRCSAVCDKEATAGLKSYVPYVDNRGKWLNKKPNHIAWPYKKPDWNKHVVQGPSIRQRLGPHNTFKPSNEEPVNQWVSGQYVAFSKKSMEK